MSAVVRDQWRRRIAMPWTEGPGEADRCTEAVLMQFGIFGKRPRDGLGVLEALMSNGWTYRPVEHNGEPFRGTVKEFYETHPTGSYYFASAGHAMALIDGLLVDTAGRGPDGRKVIGAFEVYRKGEQPMRLAYRVGGENFDQPLYHGTSTVFSPGDTIVPEGGPALGISNPAYVYCTPHLSMAGSFGEHVYEVTPTGELERDPWYENWPPDSLRSKTPLRVVRQVPASEVERGAFFFGTKLASDESYWMDHRPMEGTDFLHDLGKTTLPADVYDHPEYYASPYEPHFAETVAAIRAARGKPDALVTIYRSAPAGTTTINTGDWVAVSRKYAELAGLHRTDPSKDMPVLSARVPARTVRYGGDDLNEWGYWGPDVPARPA